MKSTFVRISGQTLVAFCNRGFPSEFGNCFSVVGSDGKHYDILNFVCENLEYLIEEKGLTYPIEMEILRDGYSLITDSRIGKEWYRKEYCEGCTPLEYLPSEQRAKIKLDASGNPMIRIIEADTFSEPIGFTITERIGVGMYNPRQMQKISRKQINEKIRGINESYF